MSKQSSYTTNDSNAALISNARHLGQKAAQKIERHVAAWNAEHQNTKTTLEALRDIKHHIAAHGTEMRLSFLTSALKAKANGGRRTCTCKEGLQGFSKLQQSFLGYEDMQWPCCYNLQHQILPEMQQHLWEERSSSRIRDLLSCKIRAQYRKTMGNCWYPLGHGSCPLVLCFLMFSHQSRSLAFYVQI